MAMDESSLWMVAIAIGAVGLVLLAMGTLAAVYWNSVRNAAEKSTAKPSLRIREEKPTKDSKPKSGAPSAVPATPGGLWAWAKAWLFASIHAVTVSLVLGGITFFEDLARASEEIKRTGTVTFPRQLMPGTVTTKSGSRGLLQKPSKSEKTGDSEQEDQTQETDVSPAETEEWELVELVEVATEV